MSFSEGQLDALAALSIWVPPEKTIGSTPVREVPVIVVVESNDWAAPHHQQMVERLLVALGVTQQHYEVLVLSPAQSSLPANIKAQQMVIAFTGDDAVLESKDEAGCPVINAPKLAQLQTVRALKESLWRTLQPYKGCLGAE